MIKAVIFDFGQTLVDSAQGFRSAECEVQKRIYADLGTREWTGFIADYRTIRKEFHDSSNFSRHDIWNAVYSLYDKNPDKGLLEELEEGYWEKICADTVVFPETKRVLEILSTRYSLALITNTQAERRGGSHRIGGFPELARFFSPIVVAGEDDIPPKPHPAPFLQCLEELDIAGSEAVYVGDDWNIDMCGASAVGMHPVWIQHCTVERTWPVRESTVPVITSLLALLDLEQLLSRSIK